MTTATETMREELHRILVAKDECLDRYGYIRPCYFERHRILVKKAREFKEAIDWMTKTVLVMLLLAICAPVYAQVTVDLTRIKQIESSGNSDAYNSKSGAIGLYQITDICRRDYNQMTGNSVERDDLYSPEINTMIAYWYLNERIPQLLRHYGQPVTLENVLISYNAGIKSVIDGRVPRETKRYIEKYIGVTYDK